MAVRPRAYVIPGMLALTALSLTACASTGTIGAGAAGPASGPGQAASSASSANTAPNPANSTAPSSGGTDAATSAPPSSAPSSAQPADPSALASSLKTLNKLWTDQGCKTALGGFSDYLFAQQKSQAAGIAAIPTAVPKIRIGAQQTKKPEAANAMNKMAADMLAMYTAAQEGKPPNKGPVKSDWELMGQICSQQQP